MLIVSEIRWQFSKKGDQALLPFTVKGPLTMFLMHR